MRYETVLPYKFYALSHFSKNDSFKSVYERLEKYKKEADGKSFWYHDDIEHVLGVKDRDIEEDIAAVPSPHYKREVAVHDLFAWAIQGLAEECQEDIKQQMLDNYEHNTFKYRLTRFGGFSLVQKFLEDREFEKNFDNDLKQNNRMTEKSKAITDREFNLVFAAMYFSHPGKSFLEIKSSAYRYVRNEMFAYYKNVQARFRILMGNYTSDESQKLSTVKIAENALFGDRVQIDKFNFVWSTYAVPVGGIRTTQLPDGTEILSDAAQYLRPEWLFLAAKYLEILTMTELKKIGNHKRAEKRVKINNGIIKRSNVFKIRQVNLFDPKYVCPNLASFRQRIRKTFDAIKFDLDMINDRLPDDMRFKRGDYPYFAEISAHDVGEKLKKADLGFVARSRIWRFRPDVPAGTLSATLVNVQEKKYSDMVRLSERPSFEKRIEAKRLAR